MGTIDVIASKRMDSSPIDVQMTTTVAVVLNHRLLSEAFAQGVRSLPDVDITGVGSSGEEAVDIARMFRPRILLMDEELPGPPRSYVLEAIYRHSPLTRIIALREPTVNGQAPALVENDQVWLTVMKDEPFGDFGAFVSDTAVRTVRRHGLPNLARYASSKQSSLISSREIQILLSAAEGLSNSQIARRLGISAGTVKNHLSSIYVKLGVSSRVAAMRRAAALGLIAL